MVTSAGQVRNRVRQTIGARATQLLPSHVTVARVDEDGIELVVRGADRVVDVLFDGRRIWSFWVSRDTTGTRGLRRTVAWPDNMRSYLQGRSLITVRDHVAEESLFSAEVGFGAGTGPIEFVNRQGLEISLDKSGRFSPTFSVRSEEHLAPLLDAVESVTAALADVDVVAFPAWGTLLGAVREQNLLGHDSDADLGYISRASAPVDVIRESFELQRLLNARGFHTYRYSGAAIRIQVLEADGAKRGLDLFAAFYDSGRLYFMGEVGTDFREEWLFPFTTCRIADRELKAPARPDKLLEAMYGPSWEVPDPAFKFSTPDDVKARLNDWFRGTSPFRGDWERVLGRRAVVKGAQSDLARLVHAQAPPGATVLDVGTGFGADALWLAGQGRSVIAYDFVERAARAAKRIAARRDLDLTVRPLNLTEMRSVWGEGAWVSRQPGSRVILARHLLDATTWQGRQNFGRFASMALRGGGRLYADVSTRAGDGDVGVRPVGLDAVVGLVEKFGGTIVSTEEVSAAAGESPSGRVDRVIAEWT